MTNQDNIVNSLAHTKWSCKYHIMFAPKYRSKVFYQEKRDTIRDILRQLCQWKGVEIIEGEICPDHIHLLVSIPPKISVSGFMGHLKGKSSLLIFQKFGNMKFVYRNSEFWCRGYYVDTVGKNTAAIKNNIANQMKADRQADQLSLAYLIQETRLRVASKMCVAGSPIKMRTCALPLLLGLCPKRKNHPLNGWILINLYINFKKPVPRKIYGEFGVS